jgi:hypothetical protein
MLLDEPEMTRFYLGSSPLIAPHLGLLIQTIENNTYKVVEAAGVEPASEKAYCKKTTCVSGSVVLVRPIRDQQERSGLA